MYRLLGPEDVSLYIREVSLFQSPLLERCPHFRVCYVQASVELGPEYVSLLERYPHFRRCYIQASMELGPEDVSLLERCPHLQGASFRVQTVIHSPPASSGLLILLGGPRTPSPDVRFLFLLTSI